MLFLHVLVPAWVVPGVRVVGRQRAGAGRFSYPRCSDGPPGAPWRWTVRAGESLAVSATVAAPGSPGGGTGTGPRFRRFEDLVDTLRNRTRAYSVGRRGLVRVKTSHPPVTVVPVAAQVECDHLLRRFGAARGLAAAPLGMALPGDPLRLRAQRRRRDGPAAPGAGAGLGATGSPRLRYDRRP